MILSPEILTIYILDGLFIVFATVAFFLSISIIKSWDYNATTQLQYSLEKRSYLASTIIKYMFFIKLPFFLFFIFTLEKISLILPGAMCGAGVVNANEYATILLFLKLINLYLFAYWIVLDTEDMKYEEQPYLKQKFIIFTVMFLFLIVEISLEYKTFYSIDINNVVDCCGTIFSLTDNTYLSKILSLPPWILLSLFYFNFLLLVISALYRYSYSFATLNLLFILISLLSLISYFGTYIYELPTHHCPFCLLQYEYNYMGYFLYTILFIGTFNGLVIGFIKFDKQEVILKYKVSLLLNFIYLVVVTLYPLLYYFKNGVLL